MKITREQEKILDSFVCQRLSADPGNRKLVNYDRVALNFSQEGNIATSKPRYDYTCEFMYQDIAGLRDFREYYFENFNPDPRDIVV